MKGARSWPMMAGVMVAAFAGGAFTQWLLLGDGGAHAAASKQATAKEIRVRSIVLVDAKGTERARMEVTADGAGCGLTILAKSGKHAIGIGVDNESAGIGLYDKDGREHLSLGAAPDGSAAGLGVTYASGKEAIGLGYGPTGSGISLRDANGRDRAALGMPPGGGAGFFTRDEHGKDTWRAP
jgi:hypothetical protein